MIKEIIREDVKVTYHVGDTYLNIIYIKIKIDQRTVRIEIHTENGELKFCSTEYYLAQYYMYENHRDLVDKWEW